MWMSGAFCEVPAGSVLVVSEGVARRHSQAREKYPSHYKQVVTQADQ